MKNKKPPSKKRELPSLPEDIPMPPITSLPWIHNEVLEIKKKTSKKLITERILVPMRDEPDKREDISEWSHQREKYQEPARSESGPKWIKWRQS